MSDKFLSRTSLDEDIEEEPVANPITDCVSLVRLLYQLAHEYLTMTE